MWQNSGVEMLCPIGDHIARGHVVALSNNSNRNVLFGAHANHILDIRYQQELAEDEVTELTAIVTAESMYTLCDLDRNEYLLLD